MLKKICPNCKNPSYSADDREWQCQNCGRLLNDIEAEPASQDSCEENVSQDRASVLARYLDKHKENRKGDDKND